MRRRGTNRAHRPGTEKFARLGYDAGIEMLASLAGYESALEGGAPTWEALDERRRTAWLHATAAILDEVARRRRARSRKATRP